MDQHFHQFYILGTYERITPEVIKFGTELRGFGYSFSSVGDGERLNGKPYFAVGAVDSQREDTNRSPKHADVILFKSAPLKVRKCRNKECKSSAIIEPNVLSRTDTGKMIFEIS